MESTPVEPQSLWQGKRWNGNGNFKDKIYEEPAMLAIKMITITIMKIIIIIKMIMMITFINVIVIIIIIIMIIIIVIIIIIISSIGDVVCWKTGIRKKVKPRNILIYRSLTELFYLDMQISWYNSGSPLSDCVIASWFGATLSHSSDGAPPPRYDQSHYSSLGQSIVTSFTSFDNETWKTWHHRRILYKLRDSLTSPTLWKRS